MQKLNFGSGRSDRPQIDYVLQEYDLREEELRLERKFVPVMGGDENDHHRAGVFWLIFGTAALSIEFFLGYQFFSQILRWSSPAAAGMTFGLIAALSLGVKLTLDYSYVRAQTAATAARTFEGTRRETDGRN